MKTIGGSSNADNSRFADCDLRISAKPGARVNRESEFVNPKDGTLLRLIPAGECIIGSTTEQIIAAAAMDPWGHPDLLACETPQFVAYLPDYYMGVYAVTNTQFAQFLSAMHPTPAELALWAPALGHIIPPATGDGAYSVVPGYENHPAVHVSWAGAEAYCRWAGLRLPTELEWEKAARGTDGRIFPWGNQWRDDALRWYGGNRREGETTAPVDAYPHGCSPYGIFQMVGNVDEWCADWYQWDVYRRYATGDLRPPQSGEKRVVRGGTCLRWHRHHFRCAYRRGNDPVLVNIHYTGIRCAADAPPTQAGTRH